MGRYDKIKVYNGTEFVQPKRIRASYSTTWLDFDTNDSSNKRSLYVYVNGVRKRITLDKTIVKHPGFEYLEGYYELPTDGLSICFSPNSSQPNNSEFLFTAYIRRTTGGAKNIFSTWGVYSADKNFLKFVINDNGTLSLSVQTGYASYPVSTATTSKALPMNEWVYVKAYCRKGARLMYIESQGETVSASGLRAWQVYAANKIGDDGLNIRADNFYLTSANGRGRPITFEHIDTNRNDSTETVEWK